ncbi:methyltransferase domain-containing protein [Streptomyces sp. H27-D2]|uniref:methyltransferase domain-containing protein n=1 Tax=Streptomyces sp. H27-D2 TaxID=3046304 RepID=UPI002DBA2642|nr:methyltransferase domain-containing protein [Streptomyces sp. H27-D2]MEC4018645.1 methyltransferase domain-containing protein [Streptomyces sp. H27-D2]
MSENEGWDALSELGSRLVKSGALVPDWAPTFAAVPRSAFLPDLMWAYDMDTRQTVAVDQSTDPKVWQRYADADVPIVTQWDDGKHQGAKPGTLSTSSASMPSVVFSMLRDLDVQPGNRVLDIGTGTGWTTALLAHRLGDVNVTSIEVDPNVANHARTALTRLGAAPTVITGDGFNGHPPGAPYDRIMVTCGLRRIPHAWIEQARPGAVIVSPWGTHFSNQDAVARLVVAADGEAAVGAFTGPVEFMKIRAQRLPPVTHAEYVGEDGIRSGLESDTTVTESQWCRGSFDPLEFVLGLRVRDCVQVMTAKSDGVRSVWLYGLKDRSWACVMFVDGRNGGHVWQGGPRHLWDEAESAYRWWLERDSPPYQRFGLTVTPEGLAAWLDDPSESWTV